MHIIERVIDNDLRKFGYQTMPDYIQIGTASLMVYGCGLHSNDADVHVFMSMRGRFLQSQGETDAQTTPAEKPLDIRAAAFNNIVAEVRAYLIDGGLVVTSTHGKHHTRNPKKIADALHGRVRGVMVNHVVAAQTGEVRGQRAA